MKSFDDAIREEVKLSATCDRAAELRIDMFFEAWNALSNTGFWRDLTHEQRRAFIPMMDLAREPDDSLWARYGGRKK